MIEAWYPIQYLGHSVVSHSINLLVAPSSSIFCIHRNLGVMDWFLRNFCPFFIAIIEVISLAIIMQSLRSSSEVFNALIPL